MTLYVRVRQYDVKQNRWKRHRRVYMWCSVDRFFRFYDERNNLKKTSTERPTVRPSSRPYGQCFGEIIFKLEKDLPIKQKKSDFLLGTFMRIITHSYCQFLLFGTRKVDFYLDMNLCSKWTVRWVWRPISIDHPSCITCTPNFCPSESFRPPILIFMAVNYDSAFCRSGKINQKSTIIY